MTLPELSLRKFIEVGAHFGHSTRRWNPKMEQFIFGERGGIHIINLDLTLPLLRRGIQVLQDCAANGGNILFVGTKRQAQDIIKEAATRCGQYYVNYRWMGGTLTNWNTIANSVKQLKKLTAELEKPNPGLTKRELLSIARKQQKLHRALGGIAEMGAKPDVLFVIDNQRESLAVKEARHLKIPIVAIVDTNADPETVDYPIPANDDAMRAIGLYCDLAAQAILGGVRSQLIQSGVDIGASTENSELTNSETAPAIASTQAEQTKSPAATAQTSESATAKVDPIINNNGINNNGINNNGINNNGIKNNSGNSNAAEQPQDESGQGA